VLVGNTQADSSETYQEGVATAMLSRPLASRRGQDGGLRLACRMAACLLVAHRRADHALDRRCPEAISAISHGLIGHPAS